MPETEDESANPALVEFLKLLLNGQRVADDTKKTYTFVWRGYRACVSSQLPKMTSYEIKRRFDLAMKSINENESFKKPGDFSLSQEPTQIPETQFDMEGNTK